MNSQCSGVRFSDEPDRHLQVGPHERRKVSPAQAHPDAEHGDEVPADRTADRQLQQTRGSERGDHDHRVEAQEQHRPEQSRRRHSEEPRPDRLHAGVSEQRGEEHGLHGHFGVRCAREPHLRDVHAKQAGRGSRRRTAEIQRSREVHRQQPEDAPHAGGAAHTGQPVEPVADGHRRRVEVRELADHGPRPRIVDQEPHETTPIPFLSRRQHEAHHPGRKRRDEFVGRVERPALRESYAFVGVDAGIAPTEHPLGGREAQPRTQGDERQRDECRPARPGRPGSQAKIESRSNDQGGADRAQTVEEPAEGVDAQGAQAEGEHAGRCQAQHHRPEDALFGSQRGTRRAAGRWPAEGEGPGQVSHDDQFDQRPGRHHPDLSITGVSATRLTARS